MKNGVFFIISVMLAATFFALPAFAVETIPVYSIDIQQAIDPIISFLFALIGAVVAFVISALWAKNKDTLDKLKIDDSIRTYLETAIKAGLQYAENKALEKSKDIKNPEVKSEIIAVALNYIIKRVPDALEHFGITAYDLAEMIVSRMIPKEESASVPRNDPQ